MVVEEWPQRDRIGAFLRRDNLPLNPENLSVQRIKEVSLVQKVRYRGVGVVVDEDGSQ